LPVALSAPSTTRGVCSRVIFPVMFDSIARRYDLANTVLSLGLHHRWKRTLVDALRIGAADVVLDAGTGTGDLAYLAASRGARVVGIDLSSAMLAVAAWKGMPPSLPALVRRGSAPTRQPTFLR
jgi:ubiquinone/menaquinone biosynthesis C-methylase UbiE